MIFMSSQKNKLFSFIKRIKNKFKNSPLYWRTLIILLFVSLAIKLVIIYFSHKNINPRENVLSYLASDIIIVFVAHLLIVINYLIKKRGLRLINNLIVFVILVVFLVDIFTIYFFQSRVSIVDAFKFWSNGSSWFSWVVDIRMGTILIVWVLAFLWIQTLNKKRWHEKKKVLIFFSSCCICYSLFYAYILANNINIESMDNIFTINITKPKEISSDVDLIEENSYEDYIKDVLWRWKNLNIIFVFAESLSAIDSANVWWNDNMPNFDKIQKDGVTFTNFIANWRSSDTAHIASLLWVMPLANMTASWSTYEWYKLYMEALPNFLNNQWYSTTFISAASLGFLNQREFLSKAWFQKIIWEEDFEDKKKYAFDAAPDKDLYDRVLKEVKTQTWSYFIWLQTISFHKPYNSPYWKTEELALKYSDEELYNFYQWLKEIWFFDNWILIIVWDHRKMNPSEEKEDIIFWDNWHTRSVATVVWSWITAWEINWNIIQHTDFYNSIKRLVWKWYVSVDSTYNDIFSNIVNRDWWITKWYLLWHAAWYTVSFADWKSFSARNLSNLEYRPGYDYFLSYVSFELWDSSENKSENNKKDQTVLIWHRWFLTWSAPENTLSSFLYAKEYGAKWIEFDISYTKDMQNIVAHWETLSASNCKKDKIRNFSYDWIQKNCTLKDGDKYKSLQDMLELVDWLFDYYFLEIKVYDEKLWAQQTLDAIQTIKNLNMQDRVIFISYSDAAREILDSDPDIIFGRDTYNVNDLDFIWKNNSKYFLAPYDMLTPEIVMKARSQWKEVVTYTINDIKNYKSIKDLWISIIMTDRLDLLQEYDNNEYYPLKRNSKTINLKKSSR